MTPYRTPPTQEIVEDWLEFVEIVRRMIQTDIKNSLIDYEVEDNKGNK